MTPRQVVAEDGEEPAAEPERLPPASSRFRPAQGWSPGRPQHGLDKQFVGD